jgi:hypothetical protein
MATRVRRTLIHRSVNSSFRRGRGKSAGTQALNRAVFSNVINILDVARLDRAASLPGSHGSQAKLVSLCDIFTTKDADRIVYLSLAPVGAFLP